MIYENGIPDYEVEVELVGNENDLVNQGDSGALSIAWNDGTTDTLGGHTFKVNDVKTSGAVNGEIATTVTMSPNTTA